MLLFHILLLLLDELLLQNLCLTIDIEWLLAVRGLLLRGRNVPEELRVSTCVEVEAVWNELGTVFAILVPSNYPWSHYWLVSLSEAVPIIMISSVCLTRQVLAACDMRILL